VNYLLQTVVKIVARYLIHGVWCVCCLVETHFGEGALTH
jgi:hypothetical protein